MMQRIRHAGLFRQLADVAIGCILARVLLGCFYLQTLQVVSNSMVPSLLGPRLSMQCPDCGHLFAGSPHQGQPGLAVCPLCYGRVVLSGNEPVLAGQTVVASWQSYQSREPARWDRVIIRDLQTGDWSVKRIVGLPGERVSIAGGDIYINQEILRKPLAVQRQMLELADDLRFRPKDSLKLPRRWKPVRGDSNWLFESGRWVRHTLVRQNADTLPIDWLAFDYWKRGRTQAASAVAAGVPAWRLFNRDIDIPPESLTATHDLLLQATVQTPYEGSFTIYCTRLGQTFAIRITAQTGDLLVTGPNGLKETAANAHCDWPGGVEVIVSTVDQQLLVAMDGQVLVSTPLPELPEAATPPDLRGQNPARGGDAPFVRPFAIGTAGLPMVVADLRVYKDESIFAPRAFGQATATAKPESQNTGTSQTTDPNAAFAGPVDHAVQLGMQEFFVLGDNAGLSLDSRQPASSVERNRIMGKVLTAF